MSRTKAQHYVPQFYLRNFSTRSKNGYCIWCYDKLRQRRFKSNPKNLAQEIGFYDFVSAKGDEASLEQGLADIESDFKTAIEEVYLKPTAHSLGSNKEAIALFLALQLSRTPQFRIIYQQIVTGTNKKFAIPGLEIPIIDENELKREQALFIIESTPVLTEVLLRLKLVLIHNRTNKPFWTSDNPVSLYNPHKHNIDGTMGLLSPGIQVHFPLNPSLALAICDPQEYAQNADEAEANSLNVEFNNSGQVIFSRQFLFSTNDDFDLAQQMIHKNPNLGDPNRSRVTFV